MPLHIRHLTAGSQPHTSQLLSLRRPGRTFQLPWAMWLWDFPPLPSSGDDLRTSQLLSCSYLLGYTGHLTWSTKEFSLNWERSTGNLCLSSEAQCSAGYQTLGALPPNTVSCPAQTQNESNAPDLWFLPVVFVCVCDFCRYKDFNKGLEGAPWFKWEWVGNTMFPPVLNTCFLVACDSWVTDTIVHLSTPAPVFHCNHTSFLVNNSKCVVCLFFFLASKLNLLPSCSAIQQQQLAHQGMEKQPAPR